MNFGSDLTEAVLRIAVAGGIAGIVGGLIGSMRASILSSLLMGVLGGVSVASIINVAGIDPWRNNLWIDAGAGFSYAWAAIGGVFLGYVVTRSTSGRSIRGAKWGKR